MPVTATRPMEIFVSYAREDRDALAELKEHLAWVIREHRIELWDDSGVLPGREWGRAIDVRLDTADMIFLLVSRHFLASDYCHGEMLRATERHTAGDAHVIPMLLQPCDFETAPFAMLQLLPSNGRPVSVWENRDEAYVSVVRGVRAALSNLHLRTRSTSLEADQGDGPASDIHRLRSGTQAWNAWRAANPRITPNLAEILQRTTTWISSSRGVAAIERIYAPIRNAINREVDARTAEICDSHDIPRSSLCLTVSVQMTSTGLDAPKGTPFDAVLRAIAAVTAAITLLFLAIAKGGLATATFSTPPPLWPVLGLIAGVAALAGAMSLEEVVRSRKIPVRVRRAFLSENRLAGLIRDARPKMREQLAAAFGPEEMLQIRNTITGQVSNFLIQRANEVKWIIA